MRLQQEKRKKMWGYLQPFKKAKGKSCGSDADEAVQNFSQEKDLYRQTS